MLRTCPKGWRAMPFSQEKQDTGRGLDGRPTSDFSYNIESVMEHRGRRRWFFAEITKARNSAFTAPGLFSVHFCDLVFSV